MVKRQELVGWKEKEQAKDGYAQLLSYNVVSDH
jgi:hypothetical protein